MLVRGIAKIGSRNAPAAGGVRRKQIFVSGKKNIPKRYFCIFGICFLLFPYMWPLAGPNIATKGWPLQKMARDDRQIHFETRKCWKCLKLLAPEGLTCKA